MRKQTGTSKGSDEGRRRYGFIVLFVLIAGLFIISTVFHIDQYTRVLQVSEEIHALENRIVELKARRKKLEILKSELHRYEVLYDEARESGMEYPSPAQVFRLEGDWTVEAEE